MTPAFMAIAMADTNTKRAERLAEALRQNLKRRKAQARDSEAPAKPKPTAD
jgi:hypothetical protein